MNARSMVMPVTLEGWILQDGNYADFVSRTEREFALEFRTSRTTPIELDTQGQPGYRPTGSGAEYEITADVIFEYHNASGHDVCLVIDFGVRAYARYRLPTTAGRDARLGDRVTGLINLGVDPFMYFEELTRRWPSIPELIYTWVVQEVQMDQAPVIEVSADDPRYPPNLPANEGPAFLRDRDHERWRSLDQTRMWDDNPNGVPLYRLLCARSDEAPTRDFKLPRR